MYGESTFVFARSMLSWFVCNCRLMASKPLVGIARLLSVVCLSSVTIVDCGQTVRDRPMVTMRHYWEVDVDLSESAKQFDLGWPWQGHFKVMKVKMEHIFSTVAPRPGVPIDKYVYNCPVNKSAPWPLTSLTFKGSFQDYESENREHWFGAMSRPSQQQLGFLFSCFF
jgi:hypothetical protein